MTQLLAASLTFVSEVMHLASVQHITVSPNTVDCHNADGWPLQVFPKKLRKIPRHVIHNFEDLVINNESAWKLAFARSGHDRVVQAINDFS